MSPQFNIICILGELPAILEQLQRAIVDPRKTESGICLLHISTFISILSFSFMVFLSLVCLLSYKYLESTFPISLILYLCSLCFSLELAKVKEIDVKCACMKLMPILILIELGMGHCIP